MGNYKVYVHRLFSASTSGDKIVLFSCYTESIFLSPGSFIQMRKIPNNMQFRF